MNRALFTSSSIGNARAVRLKRGVFFDPEYNRKTLTAFDIQKLCILDRTKMIPFWHLPPNF
jgi:hypothetical protein